MKIILMALTVLAFWEIMIQWLVRWLRKDFQWLITEADACPRINEESLNRFLVHGFNPDLGWVRKPSTQKTEPVQTVGEICPAPRSATYTIDAWGSRSNPGFDAFPCYITTYGDSFAFARHVEDHETWQHYLSGLTHSNVLNFGVGNYGLDQALRRLQNQYKQHPSHVVIMLVVPETITRIVNIWKHYSEYGNLLGFKGRYVLDERNSLHWLPNPIKSVEDYKNIRGHLDWIQKYDMCYRRKFRKDQFFFPYGVSFFRNLQRHVPLFHALLKSKMAVSSSAQFADCRNKAWALILKRNAAFTRELFKDPEVLGILRRLVLSFKEFVKFQNAIPIFVMAPYLDDLRVGTGESLYYAAFMESIKNQIAAIDLSEVFLRESDRRTLYVSPFAGAHFSPKGNRIAAQTVFEKLKELGLASCHERASKC